MKNLCTILLILTSFYANAQVLEVLNKKGNIIDRVVPGRVIYKVKNDGNAYTGTITRLNNDTIFLIEGFIKINEIAFIDQLTNYKSIVYTGCNSINYALIPIQYGFLTLLLATTDASASNDDIIGVSISSFVITLIMRGGVLLFRNYTVFDAKFEQRNCTYKYAE